MTTATYAPTNPAVSPNPQVAQYGLFGDLARTVAPVAGQAYGSIFGNQQFGGLPYGVQALQPHQIHPAQQAQQMLAQQAFAQQAMAQQAMIQQAIAQQAVAQQVAHQIAQQAISRQLSPYGAVPDLMRVIANQHQYHGPHFTQDALSWQVPSYQQQPYGWGAGNGFGQVPPFQANPLQSYGYQQPMWN